MKKILLLSVFMAVLSSCRVIPIYTENAYYLDLVKYQTDGFVVYVSDYVNFDYVNAGIVEVTVYDGMDGIDGKPVNSTYKEGTKEYENFKKTSRMRYATMDDAFMKLKDECVKKGANGVAGVKSEVIMAGKHDVRSRPLSNVIGYRLTGTAIKR